MASHARVEPPPSAAVEGAPLRDYAHPWRDPQPDVRFIRKAVPIDACAPAVAKRLLASLASLASGELMAHAQLLMSELVRQRVSYAQPDRSDELWIDISLTPDRLRIGVIDPDHHSMGAAPAPRWELQLVAELADRWGMRHDTTTTIWFELDQ
jgi:hypothetical protein